MRSFIYISGISGGLLLVMRLVGTITDFYYNDVFLISGLVLIVLIFIPLLIIDQYKQNKRIDEIIDSCKGTDKKTIQLEKREAKTKGWSMNNSPYRERRSGLTWEGGNVHGANASRGTRKSFLNR